jgi:catechol 2,3-dioxygenase-like lactoylglutathione lyase family enzyme
MKRIILVIGIAVGVISMLVSFSAKSQTPPKAMKMNAGIITTKLKESKAFYERVLNFGVTFENDFYLLMHTPNHSSEISFLLPDHPTQQPLFHKAFAGRGMYLTIEVPDVDAEYKRIKALGIPLAIDIRNEEWGDRHFAIADPNGVGIDIVTYAPSK